MSFEQSLWLAIATGAVSGLLATLATAYVTLRVARKDREAAQIRWLEERRREDAARFADLRAERYAEFLRLFVKAVNAMKDDVERGQPPADTRHEFDGRLKELAHEITLIAPEMGDLALRMWPLVPWLRTYADLASEADGFKAMPNFDALMDLQWQAIAEYQRAVHRDLGVKEHLPSS